MTAGPASSDREQDVLGSPEAGGKAIRGGVLRIAGYVGGLLLGLAATPFMIRHLGVVDFGRFVTVTSLLTIVTLVADAGLTVVGQREYATRDAAGQERLMRNIATLRLGIASTGALFAVVFSLAAGYTNVMVVGAAVGGVALVVSLVQQTWTIPLYTGLRLGLVTGLDFLRQAVSVVVVLALVILGAQLLAFLVMSLPIASVMLVLTAVAIRGTRGLRPGLDRREARYLIREAVPAAVASLLGSVFYRVSIIIVSLVAGAQQIGYFSASFRVIEVLVAIPSLIVGAAFPILARAAEDDHERLRYSLQRLFDVGVILGGWTALTLAVAAGPAIAILAGPDFDPSVPVLRIQGLAMSVSFLVPIWAGALWVLRERRALVTANLVGMGTAIALTAALAATHGAIGAAIAMTIAEIVWAASLAFALMRPRPRLRVGTFVARRVVVAGALGALPALSPAPELVNAILGSLVYFGVLVALRGVPPELWHALADRKGAGTVLAG